MSIPPRRIAVVGGGAAGFFAAIRAAELARERRLAVGVSIYEASSTCLRKVRISGGGRCNVTHHCFDVRTFVGAYPRGSRELLSPLTRFQALDTVAWFAECGVELVADADGDVAKGRHALRDPWPSGLPVDALNDSFSTRTSWPALIQYNDRADIWAANLRFAWLRFAGTGLYIVYHEVEDIHGTGSLTSNRSLVLKYSHLFDLLR